MKQNTPPDGQNGVASPMGKRIFLWIGPGLLAVAGAVYLMWKWLKRQPRTEAESALITRPQSTLIRPQRKTERSQRPVTSQTHGAPPQTASPSDESDSETRWASLPVILLGTAIITAIVTVLLLLFLDRPAFFGLELDLPQFGGSAFRTYQQQPLPIPVLQRSPTEDVAELTAQKIERLNSYGWVNEEEGIAHIPIERAMRLLTEQGLSPSETSP